MIHNNPIFIGDSYKEKTSLTWHPKEKFKSDIEEVEIVINQSKSNIKEVTLLLRFENQKLIKKQFTFDQSKSLLIGFWDPVFEKKGVSLNLNETQDLADKVGSLFNQTLFTLSSTNNGCLLRSNYFQCDNDIKPLHS